MCSFSRRDFIQSYALASAGVWLGHGARRLAIPMSITNYSNWPSGRKKPADLALPRSSPGTN